MVRELFYNVDVNANVVGLITDCTGDSDATAGVPGIAGMFGEELFCNLDDLITDCTGDFDATAGVPGSAGHTFHPITRDRNWEKR